MLLGLKSLLPIMIKTNESYRCYVSCPFYFKCCLASFFHEFSYLKVLSGAELGIVAIGNPEQHVRKASHRGSKQQ